MCSTQARANAFKGARAHTHTHTRKHTQFAGGEEREKLGLFVALQFVCLPPSMCLGMPLFYEGFLKHFGDARHYHHLQRLVERRTLHVLGFRDDAASARLFDTLPFSQRYGLPASWVNSLYGLMVYPGVRSGYWWFSSPQAANASREAPGDLGPGRGVFFDRILRASTARQVIILAPGLDARPYADYPDDSARARTFFEVDWTDLQAAKLEALRAAGLVDALNATVSVSGAPRRVHFVPLGDAGAAGGGTLDVGEPSTPGASPLVDRLVAAGLQLDQQTLVIWEGGWSYMTPRGAYQMMREIAGLAPGSAIALDVKSTALVEGGLGWALKRSFESGARSLASGVPLGPRQLRDGVGRTDGVRMWCAAHGLRATEVAAYGSEDKGFFAALVHAHVSGHVPPADPAEGSFELQVLRLGARSAVTRRAGQAQDGAAAGEDSDGRRAMAAQAQREL